MAISDARKSMIQSKTFWANILVSGGAIAAYVGDSLSAKATAGAIAIGIVNIILRTITSGEISGVLPKSK